MAQGLIVSYRVFGVFEESGAESLSLHKFLQGLGQHPGEILVAFLTKGLEGGPNRLIDHGADL